MNVYNICLQSLFKVHIFQTIESITNDLAYLNPFCHAVQLSPSLFHLLLIYSTLDDAVTTQTEYHGWKLYLIQSLKELHLHTILRKLYRNISFLPSVL